VEGVVLRGVPVAAEFLSLGQNVRKEVLVLDEGGFNRARIAAWFWTTPRPGSTI
jgi:hypothetical protein